MGGVDPTMFLKSSFSSSQGAQQAPITAASFANSGTSGMMSTDPIIVGSNGDNAFDLSSGAYSESRQIRRRSKIQCCFW